MKSILEYLWMALLVSLNGDRRHDTGVLRGFCQLYRFTSRQVWEMALNEAREVAELEPRRVLH